MFIDRKEAARRVGNSTSVLSRINPSAVRPASNGNGNGSHPIPSDAHKDTEAPPITETSEEFSEGALKSLLNVKRERGQHGTQMTTKDRATLGLAGVLLGGRRAGILMGRGAHTSHELRHGFVSQEKMYGEKKGEQDPELVDELSLQKKTVRDLAFDRLISSVGLITHDKLEKIADVTKLAKVSRDLASVVDKTTPKEQAINNGVHFHIWKPEMKEESQYETINVNAPR